MNTSHITKLFQTHVLKFRVWNDNTKKWVHGPGKEVHLFGERILLGGFMPKVGILELNDCVALPYTNSKDDSGAEIYAGDLVSIISDDQTPYIVAYSPLRDGWAVFSPPMLQTFLDVECGRRDAPAYGYILTGSVKIMGNIFDNPDLFS